MLEVAPPLVSPGEVRALHRRLASAAAGKAFVVQAGDCAETFATSTQQHVARTAGLLGEMAEVLARSGTPVVKIGRMAGQFAKPRSKPVDVLGLPAYRGDIVNDLAPDPKSRRPDPSRLLRAYAHSCSTMNYLRLLHATDDEFFTSHEALLLDYERAQLQVVGPEVFSTSAHMLWIGERTRQIDGAHLAFAALIANPVGIKIGPTTTPDEVAEYVQRLNPNQVPGRVVLVSRMGWNHVHTVLPPVIERIREQGAPVVWLCDPMHGNTYESETGYKTRDCADVLREVRGFVEVHREMGSHPGGVHLELTGSEVSECVSDGHGIADRELAARYETACDPRLNRSQSLELAREIAALL